MVAIHFLISSLTGSVSRSFPVGRVFVRGLSFAVGTLLIKGPGSSVGIATDYGLDGPGIEPRWGEIFRRPDRPWGPPNLLYNGYQFFPGGRKRPGRDANPSPPSSAEV